MSERRSVQEVERDIADTKAKITALRVKIVKAEIALREMKDEHRAYYGGFGDNGKLGELECELKSSRQFEDDAKKLAVFWRGESSKDCVIDKVTKKQIFARDRGEIDGEWNRVVHRFDLRGNPIAGWPAERIDIRATFGIDADVVPPNYKPNVLEEVQ